VLASELKPDNQLTDLANVTNGSDYLGSVACGRPPVANHTCPAAFGSSFMALYNAEE
jgi:hypothetical protein